MRFQLLPSSFGTDGAATPRQHLACFVIDDLVAFDAGSLAMAASENQKRNLRDVVLSHAHLDHIAGLPLYIDDLFASVKRPIQIHATREVIDILERDIFNWSIYPRFSELRNDHGVVLEYRPFETDTPFRVKHLVVRAVEVNHRVPAVGFIISDGRNALALTNDTAEIERFWEIVNGNEDVSTVLIECAFPNRLAELAAASYHLTPQRLGEELDKLERRCDVYVVNIKPAYFDEVAEEIGLLSRPGLRILDVGKIYEF